MRAYTNVGRGEGIMLTVACKDIMEKWHTCQNIFLNVYLENIYTIHITIKWAQFHSNIVSFVALIF